MFRASFPLVILATAMFGVSAQAQETNDIPPPKPPLVSAVPDAVDWTITTKTAAASPTPSPTPGASSAHVVARLVEVHSTVTGKLRRDVLAYSDGQKVVHWITEAMVFWTTPQGQVSVSDLRAAPPVEPGDPDPTTVGAFPGVRWLQLAYYDKVVVMGKLHAYHYVHEGSEAWIETKTLLPLAYKSGGAVYSYSFGDPPAEPLALPPDCQKAYDKMQQILSRRRALLGGTVTTR